MPASISPASIMWRPWSPLKGTTIQVAYIVSGSTGEVIEQDRKGGAIWTRFAFPTWWHYDVLRGLDYLRRATVAPDERMAEAIELVDSKRDGDGR
jgi:hypothetical protein